MILVSIYDKNLKIYSNVYCYENQVSVKRDFGIVFSSKQENIYTTYPDQFSLYIIGEFDKESGQIKSCNEFICDLSSFVKKCN